MGKIKIEVVDAKTFKCSGKAYPRGKYLPEYVETVNNAQGILTSERKALVYLRPLAEISNLSTVRQEFPFKVPRAFTDFVDADGNQWSDFNTFTEDLQNIISLEANPGGAGATYTFNHPLAKDEDNEVNLKPISYLELRWVAKGVNKTNLSTEETGDIFEGWKDATTYWPRAIWNGGDRSDRNNYTPLQEIEL